MKPGKELAFTLILFLALITGCERPLPPAEKALGEEWHLFYLEEKPAGYLRLTIFPRKGGGFVVRTNQKLILKRGETALETEASSTTEEDGDGKLLRFRFEQRLSQQSMETAGVLKGDQLVLADTVEGKGARESTLPMDKDAIGPYRAEQLLRARLQRPGDTLEVVIFLPEVRRFVRQKAVLGNVEDVEVRGTMKKLKHVTLTQDILPDLVTEEWFDEAFDLQKSSLRILDKTFVSYRSTMEEVLRQDFGSPPEIFFSSSIPVDRIVPAGAREALYRLIPKSEGASSLARGSLFKTAGQELLSDEKRSGEKEPKANLGPAKLLRVRKVLPRAQVERPIPPRPELEEFLRPNSYLQSDDQQLREIVEKTCGKERDAWKAAQALAEWVHQSITKKNLGTAFATAKEVAERREGDCTEHSVLLAALLRAAGLPSRVVAGLVAFKDTFVGHMWTEVFVGEWVPLDATLGIMGADHIGLSASSLDSSTASQFFLEILPIFGNLKVEVLEALTP
jgi:hypothetical protein